MVDFAADLANLAVPVAPKKNNGVTNVLLFDPKLFPKRHIPPEGIESFAEGIEREEMPPLEWEPLVKTGGCAFIREALRTGGKDYSQPMWNLTTLAATFLENGHGLAHRMGNNHPGYDKETTDALWERKQRERREKDLGWPSCNAIQAAGCTNCAACPHFSKGKSPLNFTSPTAAQLPANTATDAVAPPVNSPRAVPISNLPLVPRKREWVHGNDLMRGAVSMLSAPGARAKTTWLLTCALACTSGRQLLGAHVFGGPLRVLYLSAEDSTDEIALRLRAAMLHHGLNNAGVPGLHVIGTDQWGLSLLRSVGGTPIIDQAGWGALIAELDRIEPDVLVIDPLINVMGGVDVNNNSAAALLIGQLAALAAKRRIAVMIAHHVAKGRDPASAEAAMGAASFVNLCRIALGIEPLTEGEAGRIGLPPWEVKSVFRIVGTKLNYSPPGASDRWYRLLTVEIQNQQPPIYVTGDRVAVIEEFHPGSSGPTFPPQLIGDVLLALDTADPPLSPSKQSTERYAAPVIAQAIAPHRLGRASDTEAKAILDHIIRMGLVHVESVKVSRPGGRSDNRNGLVLTPAGKAVVQREKQGTSNSPPSPQSPAEPTAG